MKKQKEKKSKEMRLGTVLGRMSKLLLKRDKGLLGMAACYTVLAGIYPFFGILLPKLAIGILEEGGDEAASKLWMTVGVYALAAGAVGFGMVRLQQVIGMRKFRLRMSYLGDSFKKLLTMDYPYTEDAGFYEKYQKGLNATNNNDSGVEGIYGKLLFLPAQIVSLIGLVLMTGFLNPFIPLCMILHVAVTMRVAKWNYQSRYALKEEETRADRRIEYFYKTTHDFTCGKDIRLYNLKDRILQNYRAEVGALWAIYKKLCAKEYARSFIALFTLLLSNAVMYGLLIKEAYLGMPVSSLTMYVAAATALLSALLELGETVTFLGDDGQYAADFFKLMDEKLTTEGGSAKRPDGTLEIVFEHVDFCYPGSEENVFTDLNLKIEKGERLAIVGVNGAGKSTLVKLMTGLYEPTAGHIYINGREIREYGKRELYDCFSVVFQEVNILAFSVKENIACRLEGIEEEQVLSALSKAGLLEKVERLPHGTEQMLLKILDDEGTDLSGGERQKIAMARALYKDANMVIMDEPTAALDALAEEKIYEGFDAMTSGKTAVYISHRLASTKFCDRIALFDKTGLQEYGTHEELLAKRGSYYEMFTVQGKYYNEEAMA